MMNSDLYLDVARRIADRLVTSALWSDGACVWTIMAPDRENPRLRRAVPKVADGGVYSGTGGIALFLLEMQRLAPDESVAEAAAGAVNYSLGQVDALLPWRLGFYSGRVGVAYAAARAGVVLERPDLTEAAQRVLAPIVGQEHRDTGLDFIGGAAGAVPALLRMADWADADLCSGLAVRLGEHLIRVARHEPTGWSWGVPSPVNFRNLTGLAHGGAGVGHALWELAAHTGDERFRFAAEQAFSYERQFLNRTIGNWPDFRWTEIGDYVHETRVDELRELLRSGCHLSEFQPRYMSVWCHGAPGIGLTRLRAFQLFGRSADLEDAQIAIETTRRSLVDSRVAPGNYSLCHGRAGNAETLLLASEVLGRPDLRTVAEDCGREGWEQFEGPRRPWLCGTRGAVSDPGLLLGEAGIGYFYLRLAASEVPSVLLPTAFLRGSGAVATAHRGADALRSSYVENFFGRTIAAMRRLKLDIPCPNADHRPDRSLPLAVRDAIRTSIPAVVDPLERSVLQEVLNVEEICLEMRTEGGRAGKEFLNSLAPPLQLEPSNRHLPIQLSHNLRVVFVEWDWEAWLERSGDLESRLPERLDQVLLLQPEQATVRIRSLSGLAAAAVRAAAEQPRTAAEIERWVAEQLNLSPNELPTDLLTRLREQLDHALRARILEWEGGAAATLPLDAAAVGTGRP